MSRSWLIAREEWRLMRRDKVAVASLALVLLLAFAAILSAWEHHRDVSAQQARYQQQADREFASQPDRHPHRMAHYGHYLFRPLGPLAVFDPGIDLYTGRSLYLEAHRQNSANFGEVRQSSLLVRFGQLSPAFVLQVLAPLLLIFAGHGVLARERESGVLRVLLAQGVRGGELVRGKVLAVAGVALAVLLPAAAVLAWMALARPGDAPLSALLAALLVAAYAGWLLLWSLLVTVVSAWCRRSRDALLVLLALWAVLVVMLPRAVPDLVNAVVALPTRLESTIAVERELAAIGDSHDPDDPYYNGFRQQVLAQYGVRRVEDLPVNYKGLLKTEGERLTSALFDRHAKAAFALQFRQGRLTDTLGWLSPAFALRRLSMTVAATDLHGYRDFLQQGERYRYGLVQALNRLEAEQIRYADAVDPARENRIDHHHWQDLPAFAYVPPSLAGTVQRALAPALVLLAWLAAWLWLARVAARRLEGMAR
ncbi:DUF3526 domain-containing protein [Cupriavidus sp. P-10]|uniref:ABC transporter permease n=1 Tax=Cupriavidus sp. P-10 TaxID=2027911 RepID=UPI000E2EC561|nr:DUF3526 domain-containing protein [Cupriavidus sp. P-10]BDB24560.1 DUF3526 domain-containing protein [Cupriavidus sp. P-10]